MMKLYKSMFALIFAFSCAVLHALPLPKPQEKFLNYCNRLKDADQGEMSEFISQCTYQFADYASHNPGVSLATFTKKVSIRDVFKVAQILFSIPATLQLPKDTALAKKTREQKIENPKKPSYMWDDELIIERSEKGLVEKITYSARREGGGTIVTITQEKESIKVKSVDIVD